MKLLAPVNSLSSAEMQIASGANEIYVGLESTMFNNYSFSGRGQKGRNGETIVPNKDELKKIITLAHENNVEVSLAANTPLFSDGLNSEHKFNYEYMNNIYDSIECGVDNLIIGDIGLLAKLGKMDLPVNVHASTFFDTMNLEQVKFLKELGATRVVLTYQCSMEEIETICAAKLVEVEVFGYLSCSFFNGACNLVHNMGEECHEVGKNIGVPCKAKYKVTINGKEQVIPYLDAELGCGLCSIYRLYKAGVDVIKIAGRDRNAKVTECVTKLFRTAIDMADCKDEREFGEKIQPHIYDWWKKILCTQNRCKYRTNDITDSYIGL